MIEWTLKKLIGTKNERELKKARLKVARINELEGRMKALQNEDFARETARMKQEIANGKPLDDLLFEAFALTREAASRVIGQRHYDVQLIGGMFLHEGCIAEMRTGEGKTLTATLPSYLNALSGRGVHVVTVNDYLARRDAEWMGRVYKFLGMSTGCVLHELSDKQRQDAYRSDITYGQNNEFGFDYLRDNMKFRLQDYVQRELNYAIVDEVDSILIDEARTPLIISGPTEDSTDKYYRVDQVIPGLVPDQDYTLDEKHRSVALTDDGIDKLQKRLSVGNLYDPGEIETLHHVEQALRAHTLYKRDKDYVVKDGEVQIVDEFTGRLMPGRRWSDGLHQAIEAKEGVKIENENQTLATVSFQNYFRMYSKLSGMTGTADTEAEEFAKIYNLDVRVIPTNRNAQRRDEQDVVYKTEREKFEAVAAQIEELNKAGQPVLVGTVSIAKSEVVSNFLKKRGVAHNVLNAKAHQREADIVAQAGRKGAVTISTNMAGRGTDILLGGNAEVMTKSEMGAPPEPPESVDGQPPDLTAYQAALADYEKRFEETKANNEQLTKREREEVMAAGGLFIIGTERHESRRVDNQLRGRAGRQGDPGASRFFLSLEDDLMRIFGSERIQMLMERLGMEEGEVIEHIWLSRAIEGAQKRVEGHNFDIRKNLLEYDDVMNQQRRTIYKLRRQVLASGAGVPLVEYEEDVKTRVKTRSERVISWADFREMVLDAVEDVVVSMTDTYAPTRSSDTWDIASLANSVKESLNLEMSFEGVGNRDELQEQIYAAAEKVFTAREQEFGEDFMRFLQYRYLATIDQLWKDHLLAMDHLRQGIGLRGYGQKDPKQEYKKEGYTGFMQMLDAIKTQFVSQMMRVQARSASSAAEETARIQRQLAQQQKKAVEGRADAEGKIEEATATPVAQREAAAGPKPVGRNEPCPCGSGRKYKKCHGANEANP
ncbi:preprotein translocase subunit SecA [Corallococcus exiguus]|uniref:preprotein translocase subunit SecA n=1 Tax=Corallococcus TaxID=83461 RepID=UPI000EA2EA0D|nr:MULTISPECIES: preprotein translocase subunit SecA [Corallococcus]NNC19805.1 preprotein translocase subunit SecA [Corallococcus exiguus]NRD57273.1 preprotein translocase subunit SecA [Corallococcus exiguus]NRD66328.1 preprotein translocase subunit SecA [Corallococcus exiguus]RKH15772.1 preprotein translocase subunit SecA [Corallococcus sp. CA041A]RKI01081.1 preprotein translocase subunit SecA [Corallococcus sp. AB030]